MQHEHHDLIREFPEYREQIHNLKTTNEQFRELFDAYHKIDREVYRVENNIEPRADVALEELKKRRLAIKDELFRILRQNKP
ncbi:MAG TPA: YdcH family protein [Candidatus Wunengus sp. YC60]|uniref:YdcH family protein n=1 Tax=Candidatus Wunengus sp. YC60 TaxID=3367697 RepID=UPI0040284602